MAEREEGEIQRINVDALCTGYTYAASCGNNATQRLSFAEVIVQPQLLI
jgi:hypothetical protein